MKIIQLVALLRPYMVCPHSWKSLQMAMEFNFVPLQTFSDTYKFSLNLIREVKRGVIRKERGVLMKFELFNMRHIKRKLKKKIN